MDEESLKFCRLWSARKTSEQNLPLVTFPKVMFTACPLALTPDSGSPDRH